MNDERDGRCVVVRRLALFLALLLLLGTSCNKGQSPTGATGEPQPAPQSSSQGTVQPAPPNAACTSSLLIRSLHMADAQTGWVVGVQDGLTVRRTEDGGRHWTDVTPPRNLLPIQMVGTGAAFLDGTQGWIAIGATPTDQADHTGLIILLRTKDAGKTWTTTETKVARWETSQPRLSFTDPQHGKLLTPSGPLLGTMYKAVYETADGGMNWLPLSRNFGANDMTGVTADALPRTEYVTGFGYRNPTEGWVTALYRDNTAIPFYHTTDSGRTWRRQPLVIPPDLNKVAYGSAYPPHFFGPTAQDGVMLVSFSADPSMVVPYITHDGGETWNPQPGEAGWEQDATDTWYDFVDMRHGFLLVGDKLQVTADGGQHWQSLPAAAIKGGAIQFVSPTSGWAVTADRLTLLHTADGGLSWQPAGIVPCPGDHPAVLLQAQTGMDNKHTLAPNEQVFLLHRPVDLTLQFPVEVDLGSVALSVQGEGWRIDPPTQGGSTTGKRYAFTVEPGENASPHLTVTLTAARVGDRPFVERPVSFFIETSTPGDLLTAPLVPYQDQATGVRFAYPAVLNPPERRQPNALLLEFRSGSIALYQAAARPGKTLADLAAESIEANLNASHGRIVTDQQGETQLGGMAAAFIQSHFDSSAGRYDQRSYFLLTGGREYRISCQTRQGPPVVPWADVAPVCDRILSTLAFAP